MLGCGKAAMQCPFWWIRCVSVQLCCNMLQWQCRAMQLLWQFSFICCRTATTPGYGQCNAFLLRPDCRDVRTCMANLATLCCSGSPGYCSGPTTPSLDAAVEQSSVILTSSIGFHTGINVDFAALCCIDSGSANQSTLFWLLQYSNPKRVCTICLFEPG